MKTLNRPMFRYGGPIKEGIMSGIREPKRNGGSMMGNNEGPRRAALVGNPIYPQGPDGRTGHVLPAILGAPYIGAALRFAAPVFGKFVQRNVPKLFSKGKNIGKQIGKQTTKQEGFDPNAVGRFFANDPLAGKAMSGAGFIGGTAKKALGLGKYAFGSPSGLLFMGAPVTYMAGKYFLSDGKEITGEDLNKITQGDKRGTSGAPGGGDPGMTYTAPPTPPTAEEIEAAEAAARMKKMDSYREIMNIKGMSKDAAYKSLIDASQIIANNGNLKEGIKDGSLISKLTAAASQRFDKPRATEDALNSLLVKSKIESDLRNEAGGPLMQQAKDLVAAGGASNIKEAMEYLSKKPSITETATTFAKQFGKGFIDESTAVLAMQETFKERPEIVLSEKIFEDKKKEEGFKGVANLFETIKIKTELGEGYYVIGGHGFVVDAQGNTKQVL
jgi:hypothetical protein